MGGGQARCEGHGGEEGARRNARKVGRGVGGVGCGGNVPTSRRARTLGTRRTPTTPASTRYFMQVSSMPIVVRMTLAPAAMIFWIFSLVMSASRCRMPSSFWGSEMVTCTPSAIRWRCRLKSSSAILALATDRGICWLARVLRRAYPCTRVLSVAERPWH